MYALLYLLGEEEGECIGNSAWRIKAKVRLIYALLILLGEQEGECIGNMCLPMYLCHIRKNKVIVYQLYALKSCWKVSHQMLMEIEALPDKANCWSSCVKTNY